MPQVTTQGQVRTEVVWFNFPPAKGAPGELCGPELHRPQARLEHPQHPGASRPDATDPSTAPLNDQRRHQPGAQQSSNPDVRRNQILAVAGGIQTGTDRAIWKTCWLMTNRFWAQSALRRWRLPLRIPIGDDDLRNGLIEHSAYPAIPLSRYRYGGLGIRPGHGSGTPYPLPRRLSRVRANSARFTLPPLHRARATPLSAELGVLNLSKGVQPWPDSRGRSATRFRIRARTGSWRPRTSSVSPW